MTNCCKKDFLNTELITSSSIADNTFKDENLLKKIPIIKDSNQGIEYIISKESYQILIRKIPKILFMKKLCQNIETQEIFFFIKQSINWIFSARVEKNDKKINKYILMIQDYTKFGTKKILDELESINKLIKKEDEIFLLQSLSDWVMLIELIMFFNNSSDNSNLGSDFSCKNTCTVYDINLWYNKNIEEIIKKYCFDGCFYLMQIKIKYMHENINYYKFVETSCNLKVNNNTKNEMKRIFNLTKDFVKQISEDL